MMGLILKNASVLATPLGNTLKMGKEMGDLKIIENGCIITEGGIIKAVGGPEILSDIDENEYEVIDCTGKTILPGFVDSHTHLYGAATGKMSSLGDFRVYPMFP